MSRTWKDRPYRVRKASFKGVDWRNANVGLVYVGHFQPSDIGIIRKLNRRHDRAKLNQALREGKEPPVIKKHNLWDAL